MAVELRFKCSLNEEDYLVVEEYEGDVVIEVVDYRGYKTFCRLDITTAIKFAKTVRTEINKAKEGGQDV